MNGVSFLGFPVDGGPARPCAGSPTPGCDDLAALFDALLAGFNGHVQEADVASGVEPADTGTGDAQELPAECPDSDDPSGVVHPLLTMAGVAAPLPEPYVVVAQVPDIGVNPDVNPAAVERLVSTSEAAPPELRSIASADGHAEEATPPGEPTSVEARPAPSAPAQADRSLEPEAVDSTGSPSPADRSVARTLARVLAAQHAEVIRAANAPEKPSHGAVPSSTAVVGEHQARGEAPEARPIAAAGLGFEATAETEKAPGPSPASRARAAAVQGLQPVAASPVAVPNVSAASEASPEDVPGEPSKGGAQVAVPHPRIMEADGVVRSVAAALISYDTAARPSAAETRPLTQPGTPPIPDDVELVDQVVHALRIQVKQGIGEARVRLQPGFLGEMRIELKVEGDRVSAQLHVERADVRQQIELTVQSLRAALAAQGLRLEALTVRDDEPRREPKDQGRHEPPKRQPRPQQRPFEIPLPS